MKSAALHNFHIPLPDSLYRQLHDEAKRLKQPATVVARDAMAAWLAERQRIALGDAIAVYAERWAGSDVDLDPALEAASVEHLVARSRRKR
jgi:hypothetical protein